MSELTPARAAAEDGTFRTRAELEAIYAGEAGLARDRGISGLYLQVENDNTAARSLYRQAGFADHHGYHYRIAP